MRRAAAGDSRLSHSKETPAFDERNFASVRHGHSFLGGPLLELQLGFVLDGGVQGTLRATDRMIKQGHTYDEIAQQIH